MEEVEGGVVTKPEGLSDEAAELYRQMRTENALVRAVMSELGLSEQTPLVLAIAKELRASIVPVLQLIESGDGSAGLGYMQRAVARETGRVETLPAVHAAAVALRDAAPHVVDVVEAGHGEVRLTFARNWIDTVEPSDSIQGTPRPRNWTLDDR